MMISQQQLHNCMIKKKNSTCLQLCNLMLILEQGEVSWSSHSWVNIFIILSKCHNSTFAYFMLCITCSPDQVKFTSWDWLVLITFKIDIINLRAKILSCSNRDPVGTAPIFNWGVKTQYMLDGISKHLEAWAYLLPWATECSKWGITPFSIKFSLV